MTDKVDRAEVEGALANADLYVEMGFTGPKIDTCRILAAALRAAEAERDALREALKRWRWAHYRDTVRFLDHSYKGLCQMLHCAENARDKAEATLTATQAQLDDARAGLEEIGKQSLTAEMHPDLQPQADYECGYEECVKLARATLSRIAPKGKGEG